MIKYVARRMKAKLSTIISVVSNGFLDKFSDRINTQRKKLAMFNQKKRMIGVFFCLHGNLAFNVCLSFR